MQQVSVQYDTSVPVKETSDPGMRIISYYDAAIRLTDLAKDQIKRGEAESGDMTLGKVYSLISALSNALDYKTAPELCGSLCQIYEYIATQLVEANNNGDPAPLDEVNRHLNELKDAWFQVVTQPPYEA